MTIPNWQAELNAALDDVRLLTHPFYKRWECGMLTDGELADYAGQYRHFEAAFPSILQSIIDGLPEGTARDFVQQNLNDEVGSPSHVELFDEFLVAVDGSADVAPSPAMSSLLQAYGETTSKGNASALGALAAYELQSAEVATSKGAGLREHYGLTSGQTAFWDVHSTVEVEHAEWTISALDSIASDNAGEAIEGTRRIAEAWWAFLDEREALAPVPA